MFVCASMNMYAAGGATIDFHFCAFYNTLCCILFALSLTAAARHMVSAFPAAPAPRTPSFLGVVHCIFNWYTAGRARTHVS